MSAAYAMTGGVQPSQDAAFGPYQEVQGDDMPRKKPQSGPRRTVDGPMSNNRSGLQGIRFVRMEAGNPPVWNYKIVCNYVVPPEEPGAKPKPGRTSFSTAARGEEGALMDALRFRQKHGFKVPPMDEAAKKFREFLDREAVLHKKRLEEVEAEARGKPIVTPRKRPPRRMT